MHFVMRNHLTMATWKCLEGNAEANFELCKQASFCALLDGYCHGRLAPDNKEMLVSVPNDIGLTAVSKISCVCSRREKVFAEIGIPTLCTDSPER